VFVIVCVCCVSLLHCLTYLILFVFIRAVFSAVFSLTILSGLLYLLIGFFLVLLSMTNKDSLIHSYAQDEVNQEESEQNEVDGMKKGADSTGKVMHL